ncbi:MAG: hypothetical protein RIR97_493 [Pseudomonadota bacterium]
MTRHKAQGATLHILIRLSCEPDHEDNSENKTRIFRIGT